MTQGSLRKLKLYTVSTLTLMLLCNNGWPDNSNTHNPNTHNYIVETFIGTDGVGIGLEKPINESWSFNVRVSSLSYSGDYEADDINYDADLSQHNIQTLIHWYPFRNGFQTTIGIISTQGDYILEASGQSDYDVGSETYTGELTLRSNIQIPRVNPYLGIGWRQRKQGRGFGLGFDIGAVWLSNLDLNMNATGTVTDSANNIINISSDTVFLDNLRAEESELEEDVKDFLFPWVPVAHLHLDYRF